MTNPHAPIAIERFLRANGVKVISTPGDFGQVDIELAGSRIKGRVTITLSWTRQQAMALLLLAGHNVTAPEAG